MANRIFRHIAIDSWEFEMTAEKWNYLIMMTAGIQNVISSAVTSFLITAFNASHLIVYISLYSTEVHIVQHNGF